MTTSTDIQARGVLVKLSVTTWTARKLDRKVTDRITSEHGANKDAGNFNKHLLAGAAASHVATLQAAAKLRSYFYTNTLPWSDGGFRVVTNENLMTLLEGIRMLSGDFETAVAEFCDEYGRPEYHEMLRDALNGMYSDSDYPATESVRARFTTDLEFSPIPSEGDLRVELPEHVLESLKGDIEARVNANTSRAMVDAWKRLHEVVEHVRERLADPTAVFRDSLVGNVRELVGVLGRLNFTGDEALESMRARVEAELATCDPQALRDDPHLRADVAGKARSISDSMASFYGVS